jgi:hypothetical protein
MKHEEGVTIVDSTLTPQNAKERGYEYIDDVFYNVYSLNDAFYDILKLIKENGYKLGTPSHQNDFEFFYGLYAPIRR